MCVAVLQFVLQSHLWRVVSLQHTLQHTLQDSFEALRLLIVCLQRTLQHTLQHSCEALRVADLNMYDILIHKPIWHKKLVEGCLLQSATSVWLVKCIRIYNIFMYYSAGVAGSSKRASLEAVPVSDWSNVYMSLALSPTTHICVTCIEPYDIYTCDLPVYDISM